MAFDKILDIFLSWAALLLTLCVCMSIFTLFYHLLTPAGWWWLTFKQLMHLAAFVGGYYVAKNVDKT